MVEGRGRGIEGGGRPGGPGGARWLDHVGSKFMWLRGTWARDWDKVPFTSVSKTNLNGLSPVYIYHLWNEKAWAFCYKIPWTGERYRVRVNARLYEKSPSHISEFKVW